MDDASAREAHELRIESFESFCHVAAYAMSLVCVLRHERHHVDIEHSCLEAENLQVGSVVVGTGSELSSVLLPCLALSCDGSLAEDNILVAHEHYAHILLLVVAVAEENREVILCASLDSYAVKAVVAHAHTCPSVVVVVVTYTLHGESHVCGIVGVDRVCHLWHHLTERVAWSEEAPFCAWSPAVALCRIVLKRTVLDELRVEAAVSRVADVLKEDADKFVADLFATSRCLDLLGEGCRWYAQCCGKRYGLQSVNDFHIVLGVE